MLRNLPLDFIDCWLESHGCAISKTLGGVGLALLHSGVSRSTERNRTQELRGGCSVSYLNISFQEDVVGVRCVAVELDAAHLVRMAVEQHSAKLSLELSIGGHCQGEKSSKLVNVKFALSRKTAVYLYFQLVLSHVDQRAFLVMD